MVASGVPQGSVLGPLFFIIFINDLANHISHSSLLTFADDTKIVLPINCSADTERLQKDLDSVISWSTKNNMRLNKNKFELICHSLISENGNLTLLKTLPFYNQYNQYKIDNHTFITSTTFVKDLGIFISSDMTWDCHISQLCKTANRISAWILNIFHTRDKLTMITLFNSLVRSRLEYCCQIWDPSKIKLIDLIEQVQRNFTRKIVDMDKNDDYWIRLKKLGIDSLQRRREKLIIILLWKIKNSLVPNHINIEFKTNFRSQIKAVIPPMPRARGKLLSAYEDSFLVKSAKLFNKVPSQITECASFSLFESKLNKYLSFYPDKPPVHGYYHQNTNSITDYRTVSYDFVFTS